MSTMKHTIQRFGQPRPYADSVLVATITASPNSTESEVWNYAQTIRKAENRNDNATHDGSCGFPYGLQSYGSLRNDRVGEWTYKVTEPYTD